jgi:hypothetical protein
LTRGVGTVIAAQAEEERLEIALRHVGAGMVGAQRAPQLRGSIVARWAPATASREG